MEKVQKMASSRKGRASRAPFAGHLLYFFHIFVFFQKKLALVVFYNWNTAKIDADCVVF